MRAIAVLTVLYGFRPVSAGLAEYEGLGKGGRGSPGLQAISNFALGKTSDAYQDAIMKILDRRCGRPKSAQFITLQRILKPRVTKI